MTVAVTVRPTSLAEARDALRDSTGTVAIHGAGTKDWGAPSATAVELDTTGLDRILAHEAADQTATVQAGTRLAHLQHELAHSRQWLAVDPPHGSATVGGVFAADDHGPTRLRRGTLRDLVIGVTVVLADGTVARSGGKVIKNVAGYDLAKLCCGSLGTLALVAELTVRLHPLPEATRTVQLDVDAADAAPHVLALLASPAEPSAIDVTDDALLVRLDGRAAGLDRRVAAVRALLGPAAEVDVDWRAVADAHAGVDGTTVARAVTLPDRLGHVVAALRTAAADAGVTARLHSHAGLGLHDAVLSDGDAAAHAAAVSAWRAALTGSVVVRRRVAGLDDPAVIWGPPPPAVAVMRRVKEALDPERRLAPGRFAGGI